MGPFFSGTQADAASRRSAAAHRLRHLLNKSRLRGDRSRLTGPRGRLATVAEAKGGSVAAHCDGRLQRRRWQQHASAHALFSGLCQLPHASHKDIPRLRPRVRSLTIPTTNYTQPTRYYRDLSLRSEHFQAERGGKRLGWSAGADERSCQRVRSMSCRQGHVLFAWPARHRAGQRGSF